MPQGLPVRWAEDSPSSGMSMFTRFLAGFSFTGFSGTDAFRGAAGSKPSRSSSSSSSSQRLLRYSFILSTACCGVMCSAPSSAATKQQ